MSDPFLDRRSILDPLQAKRLNESIDKGHESMMERYRAFWAEQRNGFRKIDELAFALLSRMVWNVPRPINMLCSDCGAPWALHGVLVRDGSYTPARKYNTCGRRNPMPDIATEADFLRRFHGPG